QLCKLCETHQLKFYNEAIQKRMNSYKELLGSIKNLSIEKVKELHEAANLPPENLLSAKGYLEAKDYANAYLCLKNLSETPESNFLLGECYFHGYGVEKNRGKASGYYSLAAEKEHPGACFALGELYFHGYIDIPSQQSAIHSYKRATKYVRHNQPGALYALWYCLPILEQSNE